MVTKYQRPSGVYSGDATLLNREKYQKDAQAVPKVAISSAKIDGDFNYVIDAINQTNEDIAGVALGAIPDGSVTGVKLADGSVAAAKVADASIGTNHMVNASVTESLLAAGAVTSTKIASASVGAAHIVDGSITGGKIASETVTGAKIGTGAVTASKIGTSAVTESKIASGAVTAVKLENSGVAAGSYTTANITVDAKGRITSASNGTSVDANQLAKAWVNFNGTGTPSIRGSYNVSSITDLGVGAYRVNFSTPLANANYAVSGLAYSSGSTQGTTMGLLDGAPTATTYCEVLVLEQNSTSQSPQDAEVCCVTVNGG